jgi:hypothetical protein
LRIADVHGGIVAQQETSPEAFRLLDTLSTRGPERIRMEPADSGREASPQYTKAKPQPDGFLPPGDIVIPAFGYMNH